MDPQHVSKSFLEWFDTQQNCDVYFSWTDLANPESKKHIGAHKMILATASYVFHENFYGPLATKEDNPIYESPIADFSAFKMFLSFIYGRKITFESIQVASNFYIAANYYECKHAIKFVLNYLLDNLCRENSIEFYKFGVRFNFKELQDAVWKTISADKKILEREKFLSAAPEFVVKLYEKRKTLSVKTEKEFLVALERYIAQNLTKDPKIAEKIRAAIQKIDFLKLTKEEVRNTTLLSKDEKAKIFAKLKLNGKYGSQFEENPFDDITPHDAIKFEFDEWMAYQDANCEEDDLFEGAFQDYDEDGFLLDYNEQEYICDF
ncbi:BTB/POZ domain-containing protein 6-B-like [Culicoides brevitarsis]|uniref:BTB/POZ domain-containing protein 6-B-like n=1 Tax=Culicoides brevitarsis TaxID=469753 RepID=UPI00307B9E91